MAEHKGKEYPELSLEIFGEHNYEQGLQNWTAPRHGAKVNLHTSQQNKYATSAPKYRKMTEVILI